MVDVIQIGHMVVSAITALSALYFKNQHSKLGERISVLEERTKTSSANDLLSSAALVAKTLLEKADEVAKKKLK